MKKQIKSPEPNSLVIEVTGMNFCPRTKKGQRINASVMFTSDEHGERLSIFNPATKKQVIVPFAEVEYLVEIARRKRAATLEQKEEATP